MFADVLPRTLTLNLATADLMGPREISLKRRRDMMAAIRRENTKPELAVRRILWAMGVRYRLHAKDLPGRPDVVMRKKRIVVFVHGCLWHLHKNCALVRIPKSRPNYWPAKLQGNHERDIRNRKLLESEGWRVIVVWECEVRNLETLRSKLDHAFSS